jgi:hypothetical protein
MRSPRSKTILLVGVNAALIFLSIGCGRGPTAEQAVDARLKQDNLERQKVCPLAGRVTIDGKPPGSDTNVVVVVLNDPTKPELPLAQRPYAICTPGGDFAFSTYLGADGVRSGEYIATFAMVDDDKRGLLGPDQLKNLYNDPEKNKAVPEFHIDHKEPGRKDYAFDLKVSGKEPVGPPGKFAFTGILIPARMRNMNR